MPVEITLDLAPEDRARYEAMLADRETGARRRHRGYHWGGATLTETPVRVHRDGYQAELDLRYRGLRRA